MAAGDNTSFRPRDRAGLIDALDRNRALEEAFHRIAGNSWEERELLRAACLSFLFTYENFSRIKARAHAELLRQQKHVHELNALVDALRLSRERGGSSWADVFIALHRAAMLAKDHMVFDQALAGIVGLSHKNTPLNAALRKLIEVAGNRDAAVASLAMALLDQIGKTLKVTAPQVRWVRRASGIVVRRPT